MDDKTILTRIHDLVEEEHGLRSQHSALQADDRRRLEQLELELDQCWDLLRRRRAREEIGEDPDEVSQRSVDEVESYLQ